tara:strand:+ start:1346 stop:1582 length:237 start_codon:yes stop_codon:yes gene_type:complete
MTPAPKKQTSFIKPKLNPEPEYKKTTSNIKDDFKSIIQLKIELRGKTDKELKAFATKYNLDYKDVAEIPESAKHKFNS